MIYQNLKEAYPVAYLEMCKITWHSEHQQNLAASLQSTDISNMSMCNWDWYQEWK